MEDGRRRRDFIPWLLDEGGRRGQEMVGAGDGILWESGSVIGVHRRFQQNVHLLFRFLLPLVHKFDHGSIYLLLVLPLPGEPALIEVKQGLAGRLDGTWPVVASVFLMLRPSGDYIAPALISSIARAGSCPT